ncbi:MAG: hypothetical protein ACR2RB_13280, partial [Gammaproteobacteria bacterium]
VLVGSSHAATPEELMKRTMGTACTDPAPELGGMAKAIGGVETSSKEPIAPGGTAIGWRRIFARNGSELALQRIAPGGRGACPPARTGAALISPLALTQTDIYQEGPPDAGRFALRLELAIIHGAGLDGRRYPPGGRLGGASAGPMRYCGVQR